MAAVPAHLKCALSNTLLREAVTLPCCNQVQFAAICCGHYFENSLKVFILASFSVFLTVNSFSAECERLGGSIASGQLGPRLPNLQHARHLP